MLIEFKVQNYRSIRSEQTMSMVAGSYTEHLDSNTAESGVSELGRLLRSSVLYGANAAGKTNVLRALQFMQTVVVTSAANTPSRAYRYDPFKFDANNRGAPSSFEVAFLQNGTRYEYGFSLDEERIHSEWLIEYAHPRGRTIFERDYDPKSQTYEWKLGTFLKGQRTVWRDATRPNALFLSTAVQLNSEQLLPVFEWFQKRLVVIVGVTALNPSLTLQLLDQPDGKPTLLPFLQVADRDISDISISRESVPQGSVIFPGAAIIEQVQGEPMPRLVKVSLSHSVGSNAEPVALDLADESNGTQILFRTAGALLNVFANGEVLLFDEIETSLHPLLIRYLVQRFNSSVTNKNNAQLVFSTHNTFLLEQDVFRRDQIWFVEKATDGGSRLYPLSDFKPRNDEVLERWYMRGKYGALPTLTSVSA